MTARISSPVFVGRGEELERMHTAFAGALLASIRRDMTPENAWLIAAREKPPVLSGLNYSLGKLSEKLPIFDIWPFPYATRYELVPGCNPIPPGQPGFYDCYEDVGAFPEVDLQVLRHSVSLLSIGLLLFGLVYEDE